MSLCTAVGVLPAVGCCACWAGLCCGCAAPAASVWSSCPVGLHAHAMLMLILMPMLMLMLMLIVIVIVVVVAVVIVIVVV